jgi:hypothetical protein
MRINLLLSAILSFAALIVADCGEKGKKPCCGCLEEREATLIATQKRLQELAQACDYQGALALSLPDAGYWTLDYDCPEGCCSDAGPMTKWWSFYSCSDRIFYPVEPVSIRHLGNGTSVYGCTEILAGSDGTLYAYELAYSWDLQMDCTYKLSLITGHSYNCPAFLPGAVPCSTCNVNP